jgi:hypothetical protein
MNAKVKIIDVLGKPGQTEKGFIQQYTVLDVTGAKSVIKIFSKKLDLLPSKEGQEAVVECQDFCFIS